MSKLLYVYRRTGELDASVAGRLRQICEALVPDNVVREPVHRVRVEGGAGYAVATTSASLGESGMSVRLGVLYGENNTWAVPLAPPPDGSFAIVRANDDLLEVVSDAAGSRTLWYYHDEEQFVAATTQVAIITFLRRFEFDERVIPWMLSTGTLGPRLSWDTKILQLPPDATLVLDKHRWALTLTANTPIITVDPAPEPVLRARLKSTIAATVGSLRPEDVDGWVLPLSGGYDSRALLCFLDESVRRSEGFRAVTWGLAESLQDPANDAKVASDLAKAMGIRHEYRFTDVSSEPVETIVDRFLRCGEGRIDQIAGYADGFEIWRSFHDEGVKGTIRGDHAFGGRRVSSDLTLRMQVSLGTCSDYANLEHVIDRFDLPPQEIPQELTRRAEESLDAWRDRLVLQHRVPTEFAALSELKSAYVESINPLLSRAVLHAARSAPDELRTEKELFRRVVRDISPAVPFASQRALAFAEDLLKSRAFVGLMREELDSASARQTLGSAFIDHVLSGLNERRTMSRTGRQREAIKRRIKSKLPRSVKNWFRDRTVRPTVDANVLAFRVFMILKMRALLSMRART